MPVPERIRHACPTCGRERLLYAHRLLADLPTFPFCCERCRKIDLGRWLDEDFRISEPLTPPDGSALGAG